MLDSSWEQKQKTFGYSFSVSQIAKPSQEFSGCYNQNYGQLADQSQINL